MSGRAATALGISDIFLGQCWDSAGNTCHIAGENCLVGGRGGRLTGDGDGRHMTAKMGG